MNTSSIDQNYQSNPKVDLNRPLKKKAPISLITNTQTIFIKNKRGNIASSYIDGSQKIQKSLQGKTILKNYCVNQPTAPIQSINNHIKNQSNILKTIQTSIVSNYKPNQTQSTHSIVNAFNSKITDLQLKDNAIKEQNGKGSKKSNDATINSNMNEKANVNGNANVSKQCTNSHNVLLKMGLKNKDNNAKNKNANVNLNKRKIAKKSFVKNLDKINSIKNKLHFKENKFKKVLEKIQAKKPLKKTETVSISLKEGKNANCTFRNHKCLNSLPGDTTNITMPSKIDDSNSYTLTQTVNNLYCNTIESQINSKINANTVCQKEKEKQIPKVIKPSELKIEYKKGNNISVSISLGHEKQNTSSSIVFNKSITVANDKNKEQNDNNCNFYKDKSLKKKNSNYNREKDKKKAPKCPIKLNLLSLIQENKIKLKKEKEFNSSRCSNEDIDTILYTVHELIDTQRYQEFDNYDDVNSIVKKIHFEKVNKKSVSIFSEDTTVYQLYSHKFTERFLNRIQRYKNSEQRTNASISTCENSSKKPFMSSTKCTLRNNLQIEII